jgi:hypothetical protein
MSGLESAFIQCPYCGEPIEVLIDTSVDSQAYIEDCSVCCQPINLQAECRAGEVSSVSASRDDE